MSRNWVFRPTLNSMQTGVVARSGRPRDAGIDAAVLSVTLRHLAESGLSALSVAAIAQEAGTTRPAIYRRRPTKLQLAVAAVAGLAEIAPPIPTDDPYADLISELVHFPTASTRPARWRWPA